MTSFQLNDKDRDELVELLIESALQRKNDLSNDRETLIDLIKEFEGSLANGNVFSLWKFGYGYYNNFYRSFAW